VPGWYRGLRHSRRWTRALIALGHEVKLMPAQYMKPCVRRDMNDPADAEAICEAVARPIMRFVVVEGLEQQSAMMLHGVRLILMRQRTQVTNAIRAHLAEFGIISPVGHEGIERLLDVVSDTGDGRIPPEARPAWRCWQPGYVWCRRRSWRRAGRSPPGRARRRSAGG
jgi:transposase